MWLQMPLPSELGVNLVFMRRSCALEDNPPPLTMGRGRIMGSLLFLRRSCEYRHAAVEAFRNARAMPSGSERTVARVLARGLRDLARAEAWLEGQRSHLSVPKAAASPLSLVLFERANNSGLALDWPNYSRGMYVKIQREAEHAGRGMWSGSYVAPWLYRSCIRAGGQPTGCSTTRTRILKNTRPPLRLQIFCTTNADRRDVAKLVRAQVGR
jgi:hypothetical protein